VERRHAADGKLSVGKRSADTRKCKLRLGKDSSGGIVGGEDLISDGRSVPWPLCGPSRETCDQHCYPRNATFDTSINTTASEIGYNESALSAETLNRRSTKCGTACFRTTSPNKIKSLIARANSRIITTWPIFSHLNRLPSPRLNSFKILKIHCPDVIVLISIFVSK
jgi:hypothetical protein